MPRRRLLIASLALVPVLSSCGGNDAGAQATLPPLTPEPGLTLPSGAADVPAGGTRASLAARVALAHYLRGIGTADPRVCSLVTPAYERTAFGAPGGCRTYIRQVKRRLRANDLLALRTVFVPTATPGPGAAEYTIEFADLRWRTDPARPGGVLAARYVLHRTGRRWLITA